MRKFYPLIFLLLLAACGRIPIAEPVTSQTAGCDELDDIQLSRNENEDSIESCVMFRSHSDPETWKTYLEENLVPDSLMIDSIPAGIYKVMVQFELERNGNIVNAVVITDPGHGLGEFSLNVIKRYKEKPLVADYRVSKSYHRQPLTFVFEEETCDEESGELLL